MAHRNERTFFSKRLFRLILSLAFASPPPKDIAKTVTFIFLADDAGNPQRLEILFARNEGEHREQHAPGVDVEIVVEALDGDISKLHTVDGADIGNHHVEPAAVGSDLGVEAVEILKLADVALYAGDVPAD
jgi:hypothetical protein